MIFERQAEFSRAELSRSPSERDLSRNVDVPLRMRAKNQASVAGKIFRFAPLSSSLRALLSVRCFELVVHLRIYIYIHNAGDRCKGKPTNRVALTTQRVLVSNGIAGAERKVALSSRFPVGERGSVYRSTSVYTLIVIGDMAPGPHTYDACCTSLIVPSKFPGRTNHGVEPRSCARARAPNAWRHSSASTCIINTLGSGLRVSVTIACANVGASIYHRLVKIRRAYIGLETNDGRKIASNEPTASTRSLSFLRESNIYRADN